MDVGRRCSPQLPEDYVSLEPSVLGSDALLIQGLWSRWYRPGGSLALHGIEEGSSPKPHGCPDRLDAQVCVQVLAIWL